MPKDPLAPVSQLPEIGVGMDSCVLPISGTDLFLIQTTDFFYPLVEDPYTMGKITCANVLSDLYAMGVVNCNNMLMLMGVSQRMSEKERNIVVPLIISGFKDLALEAGTTINGGQTVMNPWMTIGGVATAICNETQFIMPNSAEIGDLLILTKPLGIQMAVNAHQWINGHQPDKWSKISSVVTEQDVNVAYRIAMASMARLNRTGAQLMHKYKAHGATDVTGFGILGHAKNLASVQKRNVTFDINLLPVIANVSKMASTYGIPFNNLHEGLAAETSGGLLVVLPKETAEDFCAEIFRIDGVPAWIVGEVREGNRTAILSSSNVIEVPQNPTAEGCYW